MQFKIDHINLSVENINDSLDWYRRVFAMEKVEEGASVDGKKWAIAARNDSMVCMTEIPKLKSPQQYQESSNHQVYHFGIRITDKESWLKTIEKEKLELFYGGRNDYPHSQSWYVRDPTGHSIEVSYSESSHLVFPSE